MAQNTVNNMAADYTAWTRINELVNKDGEIWMWDPKDFERDGVFASRFSSQADAQEYARLRNERRKAHGHEPIAYAIGTESDFIDAMKNYQKQKKADEQKAYAQHIKDQVALIQAEIKCLEAVKDICRKFDGKVINKRFHDAIKVATGFSNVINSNWFELTCYTGYSYKNYPNIRIRTDFSHGRNPYTGKAQEVAESAWQWNTNDRLEAEKAIHVIECVINQRNAQIASLTATVSKYTEYLKKARQAEKLLKDLEGYDYNIRYWAMEHDLTRYAHTSSIWKH